MSKVKTQYERYYTVADAQKRTIELKTQGFMAYYQTKNSYNYEVRYWMG